MNGFACAKQMCHLVAGRRHEIARQRHGTKLISAQITLKCHDTLRL